MSEITNTGPQPVDLTTATSEDLKSQLVGLLAQTAEDLLRMAMIVRELENRGEDLSDLKLGLIDHLRRIASQQLLPELVVRFAGNPGLLRRVSNLPLSDQKKLAEGQPLEMAVWRGDAVEWRKVDPLYVTGSQLSQLIASDRIRSQQEQVSLLEHRRETAQRQRPESTKGKVKADKAMRRIQLGRKYYDVADVVAALAELAGESTEDEDRSASVVVKLTENEHYRIKQAALDGRVSVQELARRALQAHGVI